MAPDKYVYDFMQIHVTYPLSDVIIALGIMAFLCLFWGVLYRQIQHVHKLSIWVVDFDGQAPYGSTTPFVGPFVTQTIRDIVNEGGAVPGYTFVSPEDFGNDPLNVRESVYNFHAWAAVIINANATALLDNAVRQGNSS